LRYKQSAIINIAQFYVDTTTDTCSLYTWEIKVIDTFNKTFTVAGDQTYVFTAGSQFTIAGSTGNDGTYDVIYSVYDSTTDYTLISVDNPILSAAKDGLLKANYRQLPWDTGSGVYLSTAETLPIPLEGDTVNGLTRYYIIKISNTTFKIANTENDAILGSAIDITSKGRRDHFVGEVLSTFSANGAVIKTTTNWRYYALDKSNILEINTLPALTPATCIFHQAAEVGLRPMDLIDKIIELGLENHKNIQVPLDKKESARLIS